MEARILLDNEDTVVKKYIHVYGPYLQRVQEPALKGGEETA